MHCHHQQPHILALLAIGVLILLMGGCNEDAQPAQQEELTLTTKGTTFRDAHMREVILRGVNAGGRSKLPPFMPFPYLESEQANGEALDLEPFRLAVDTYTEKVKQWGHNVVRVPFSWEGVEPTRGEYDEDYLRRYRALVQSFSNKGIRVVVDFHQDAFSRAYCGDGFPLWAMANPDQEFRTGEDCEDWFSAYLGDKEVDAEYDRFWSDQDGLHDAFEAMWVKVVQSTHDIEGVIGYEIINEPHNGTYNVSTFYDQILIPLYQRIGAAIRGVDSDALVFLDLTGVDSQFGGTVFEMPEEDYFVFAPHYYATFVFLLGPDVADRDWNIVEELTEFNTFAQEQDTPLFLGEFGTVTNENLSDEYYQDNFAALDHYLHSGTAWEYSTDTIDWNNEGFRLTLAGGVETESAQACVRPYPDAIAGTTDSFNYTRGEPELSIAFHQEEFVTTNISHIRIPARLLHETQPSCTFQAGQGDCSYNPNTQNLVVTTTTWSNANNVELTVTW